MRTAIKVIFASALLFSAVAPSLSYASYFVDQTKTWAVSPQPDVMGKKVRVDRALDAMAFVPADNNFGNEYFQKGGILNQH